MRMNKHGKRGRTPGRKKRQRRGPALPKTVFACPSIVDSPAGWLCNARLIMAEYLRTA